jgi:hypothetical protein
MRANLSNTDGVTANMNGAVTAPELLKHLSAHPATDPQSFVFFSHGSW